MKKQQKYAIVVSALVVLIIAGASGPAHATLIQNGSFESPPLNNDDWKWNFQTTIADWTVTTPFVALFNHHFGTAQDGAQWMQLQGINSTGTIAQSFSTTVGKEYDLSFYYAVMPSEVRTYNLTFNIGGTDQVIAIPTSIPGWLLGSVSSWTPYTYRYTATAATTTLSFTGDLSITQPSAFYGPALDNVSVEQVIPEPSTVLLLGLGGLLAWRRRVGN